jgi:hypothetical protein
LARRHGMLPFRLAYAANYARKADAESIARWYRSRFVFRGFTTIVSGAHKSTRMSS